MTSFFTVDNPLYGLALFAVALGSARVCRAFLVPVVSIKAPLIYYETLEGLRGVLAVAVFVHHANTTVHWLLTKHWEAPPTRFFCQLGQPVVALFFMLTAFLFWDRVLRDRERVRWRMFFAMRLMRLAPLYLLVVAGLTVLSFAVMGWALHESPLYLARNILAWVTFTVAGWPDINTAPETWRMMAGVAWSLRFEWLFYLALPFLGWLLARTKHPASAMVSLVSIVLYLLVGRFTFRDDAIKFLPFLGGFVAVYWIRSDRLLQWGRTKYFGWAALVAAAATLFAAPRGLHVLTLALLTLIFVAAACDNGLLSPLRKPSVLFLGKISYSIYLLHGMCLWSVFHSGWSGGEPLLATSATQLSLAFLVVVISSLTYRFVEEPGLKLGRKWTAARALPVQELKPSAPAA